MLQLHIALLDSEVCRNQHLRTRPQADSLQVGQRPP